MRHERLVLSGKSCLRVLKNNRSESQSVHAGSYDHFLNFQIGFIIILQLAMCVFCAVAAYIWRNHSGWPRYQLAMYAYVEGNYENGAAYTFILFITFWILYSYLVPISLFVTMEIVKFWQVLFFPHVSLSATDCAAGVLGTVMLCLLLLARKLVGQEAYWLEAWKYLAMPLTERSLQALVSSCA